MGWLLNKKSFSWNIRTGCSCSAVDLLKVSPLICTCANFHLWSWSSPYIIPTLTAQQEREEQISIQDVFTLSSPAHLTLSSPAELQLLTWTNSLNPDWSSKLKNLWKEGVFSFGRLFVDFVVGLSKALLDYLFVWVPATRRDNELWCAVGCPYIPK